MSVPSFVFMLQRQEISPNFQKEINKIILGEYTFGRDAERLLPNTNLDDLTKIGAYACKGQADASTIINTPFANYGYMLYVLSPYSLKNGVIDYGTQIAVSYTSIKVRGRSGASNQWGSWETVITY